MFERPLTWVHLDDPEEQGQQANAHEDTPFEISDKAQSAVIFLWGGIYRREDDTLWINKFSVS